MAVVCDHKIEERFACIVLNAIVICVFYAVLEMACPLCGISFERVPLLKIPNVKVVGSAETIVNNWALVELPIILKDADKTLLETTYNMDVDAFPPFQGYGYIKLNTENNTFVFYNKITEDYKTVSRGFVVKYEFGPDDNQWCYVFEHKQQYVLVLVHFDPKKYGMAEENVNYIEVQAKKTFDLNTKEKQRFNPVDTSIKVYFNDQVITLFNNIGPDGSRWKPSIVEQAHEDYIQHVHTVLNASVNIIKQPEINKYNPALLKQVSLTLNTNNKEPDTFIRSDTGEVLTLADALAFVENSIDGRNTLLSDLLQ